MCPPAQPPPPEEIGLYWSDEQIILLLVEYKPGSRLLNNVIEDSSPYQYPPSNLPEGIWYLVQPNEKKESVFGFWRAKGEACKIYSNSMINGWRTTLEYFEGQAPHGQRTDWLMQEYWITKKELSDKDKPKESRSLCRIFLCGGHSSKSEMHPKNLKTVIESKEINSVASIIPNTKITFGKDSRSESKAPAKTECESDKKPISSPQVLSELECLSRGDYLELNDLEEDLQSHSSSSQNSSCVSESSDEYFDSLALLRDLQDEENKQSSSKYSFNTSVRTHDVVLQPPPSSGSLLSRAGSTNVVEGSQTGLTIQERLADKRVQEHTTKRHSPDTRAKGTSNVCGVETPSTSHNNATQGGEKKASAGKMKKLKMYFCFMF